MGEVLMTEWLLILLALAPAIVIVCLPPKYDPAILLSEWVARRRKP